MRESQIQRACLDLLEALRLKGWPVYATRSNSGRVRTIDGYSVTLCREGWPDITAIIRGRFVGIETKGTKGRQGQAQKKAQQQIEAAGGVYLLVNQLSQLREYLGVGEHDRNGQGISQC